MKFILPIVFVALIHVVAISQNGYYPLISLERKTNTQNTINKRYPGENINIIYHRLVFEIDPSQLFISGSVTTYFKPVYPEINQITFDLNDSLTIDSITCNYAYTIDRSIHNQVRINFENTVPIGVIDSLTIHYKGTPQYGNGHGSFVQDYHAGIPVIWTFSQPYGSGDWWPCKNDLSDKIDSMDVFIKTPQPYRAATVGILKDSVPLGNSTIYHWKHNYPLTASMFGIAVTNYVSFSDFVEVNGKQLEVLNYVYPEDLSIVREQAAGVLEIITLFNGLFIPYPFLDEKYGHAMFGKGGGEQTQTMSFMGNFTHDIMAHELAHSWFCNYITTTSWQEIWLNEGFATYCTGLSYENMFSGYYWPIWKSNTLNEIISEPDGSVYVYDTSSVWRVYDPRLTYHKASFLVHMIRWTLGDNNFFQAIRNYLNDPDLAYGYASTMDLKYHLEHQSGQDLTEFFNDWLYGEGYPSYNVKCSEVSSGNFKVTINQSQSHPSVSFFEMPVPIKFSSELQDTLIVFNHKFSGQEFMVELGFLPDTIVVDPDIRLISGGNSYTLGIGDIQVQSEISVLPNPFIDEIVIQSSVNLNSEIILFDPYGKMVFEKQTLLIQNQPFSLKTDHVKEGIYILNIETKKRQYHWKMVKKP